MSYSTACDFFFLHFRRKNLTQSNVNCQAWLHDHVIPVYNTGFKTFINYVDKSLAVHLMKATKMIWKHNLQVLY